MVNLRSIIILLIIGFTACIKENTPVIPLNDSVDTGAMGQQMGNFMNGPYGMVSGSAKVYKQDNEYVLALQNVSISNGPDLHVYVSKEVIPVNFIDLGSLKSTIGNQVYSIPGNPDFSQYKYALIHCKRYNHLFGSAELQ
jgi:hypothetical protein